MYYYEIEDSNSIIIKQSTTGYNTGDDAVFAGKDELSTIFPAFPVIVKIYDGPPDDLQRYMSSTYYLINEDIVRHALARIEKANREEFGVIIETAHADSRVEKGKYEQGLITPLEFAKLKTDIWSKAWYDIESKG